MIFFIALKTCMQERVDAGENELGSPSPLPSVFKEGWLRINKKLPFLSGADGVVSNFKQK
jgi:hypothetical protein